MTLDDDDKRVELLDVDGGPQGPDPEFDEDVNVIDDSAMFVVPAKSE
jgi:hypothetical protein